MQSHTISCWGKRIRGKTVVIDFISSLWRRVKEEVNEKRLALWCVVWFSALQIAQMCNSVNRDSSGVRTQWEKEDAYCLLDPYSFLFANISGLCWKETNQGSGERLYASTQTNRWTGLERRDKWIAQQVDSANMLQLTEHCRTSGNRFLFFLLCLFLRHII